VSRQNIKYRIDLILAEVQNLEEIGGPDTLEEYVEILTAVQAEVTVRLESARHQIQESKKDKKPH